MHAPAPGPAIFWITFGAYCALEIWVAARDRRAGVRDSSDPGVRQITFAFMLAGVLAFVAAWTIDSLEVEGWAPLIAGVAMVAAGIGVRLWAVLTLGRLFRRVVVIQEGHALVTTGPYRYVRHPSYSGALLSMLGIGVALGNLLSIAICLIVPAMGYMSRIPNEEAALEGALGDKYRNYADRTKRLVPRVW